jgi:hypothetical protein
MNSDEPRTESDEVTLVADEALCLALIHRSIYVNIA